MQSLPESMDYKCLGRWSLEIRTLPALLSSGSDDVERTVLSPAHLDVDPLKSRSYTIPMHRVPMQFRGL